MGTLLNKINSPGDIKALTMAELKDLAQEIREFIVAGISQQGGHLSANLGSVEITLALHYVFNSPNDKIVWDVGHQSYTHKILTGRKDRFSTLRQLGGLSGFPNIDESPHDHFTVGHASTSLSQALGLAVARDMKGEKYDVACICGDGSLTGGLAYEGLNNIGHLKKKMLIILNDNEMAIAKSIGSMSKYLNEIITNPIYNRIRSEVDRTIKRFPRLNRFVRNVEESFKNILVPGIVFEELGIRYFGPVDGHNIEDMIKTIKKINLINEPCMLHVLTKKGKGVQQAEFNPATYHSSGPYTIESEDDGLFSVVPHKGDTSKISYTRAFSQSIVRTAERDQKVVALTAAMPDGTGLAEFQKRFPKRFFDVGIAEGHAITFAGALSRSGFKPVCAIYSTFLQRAYDHVLHDVALQKTNLTVCIDRAGIVGADGPTHHGLFDIALMRTIPNSVVAAPKDEAEMQRLIDLAIDYRGVFAIRYPKASMPMTFNQSYVKFAIGEGECLREGTDVAVLTLGDTVPAALQVADSLKKKNIAVAVYNMRFVKPLDEKIMNLVLKQFSSVVTIEEHVVSGGFGSAVLEYVASKGATVKVRVCAFPDAFIEHGDREVLFKKYGMDPLSIAEAVSKDMR